MKKYLIDGLATWFVGAKTWGDVQGIVHIIENLKATGAEKRAHALELVEELGVSLAKWMINLALELAVAKMRLK